MLHLVQSNHLEILADRLIEVLAVPGPDPFVPETVVVQNTGMARWLSQQIAERTGIAANIDFPLPARFIWEIFAGQIDGTERQEGFNRRVLYWKVLDLLKSHTEEKAFGQIREYLRDDRDGLKTFYLAGKITDLFDQYLVFRPGMLLEWEEGRDRAWQAILWRKLTENNSEHRARLLFRLAEILRIDGLRQDTLPPRICLFGISSLAPAYLEVIHGVSSAVPIYLFHLNPCRQFWADLASSSEMAQRRRSWRRKNLSDVSSYFDEGNPLLASLGHVGREFAHQLAQYDLQENTCYGEPEGETLLAGIQSDILDLRNRTDPSESKPMVRAEDRSLQFHSCYSRLREVQVLHDRLLELFEQDSELIPGDILVMAPDIETYASAIRAVFSSGARENLIPWSIADRSPRSEQPLVEAFLHLFSLAAGRAAAPEVQAILETEAVRRKFQIDSEGLRTLRRWIAESGIRWGFDREHRERHNLDMTDLHSWSFGLNRLFLGYFTGSGAPLFKGIAPCGPMTSEESLLLGRLADFLDRLQRCCQVLQRPKSAEKWGMFLLQVLDDFFEPAAVEEDDAALGNLRDAVCRFMDESSAAGYGAEISYRVVQAYFNQALSVPAGGHQAFLAGRVTFCNMVPMRSIPFAVICLLGMNDTDYPRTQKAVSFDLMAAKPLPGDRNRRHDDRYLFLEALFSARKVFYISWVGHDQQDNSVRAPSVVVSELIDYVERGYRSQSDRDSVPAVIEHPFQPFSRRCFAAGSVSWSYAGAWFPGAEPMEVKPFIRDPLPEADTLWRTVDLEVLKRFWAHPVKFFLRERLGMQLGEEDDTLPETEPFAPDSLAAYHLLNRLMAEELAGKTEEDTFARLRAEGVLPHGGFGENVYEDLETRADELVSRLAGFSLEQSEPIEIDLEIGDFRLTGWLESPVVQGCLHFRPARLKGVDLVKLWLDHLVLGCLQGPEEEATSWHVASDATVRLGRVADPLSELHHLLALYWQGLREPLHFFPETAMAWQEAAEGRRTEKAEAAWNGGYKKRGEREDPVYQVIFKDRMPLDERFASLAAAVFDPLFRHREDS